MLHKRKLQLAVAWISLKSADAKSGELIKSAVDPLISTFPLTHQERMKKVFESAKKYQESTALLRLAEWEGETENPFFTQFGRCFTEINTSIQDTSRKSCGRQCTRGACATTLRPRRRRTSLTG